MTSGGTSCHCLDISEIDVIADFCTGAYPSWRSVAFIRRPSSGYNFTARRRSSYEYMNCFKVVQVFVRISSRSPLIRFFH